MYIFHKEWRHGRGGHLTLQDYDVTTKNVCGWKKLNTLAHYGVKESAVMTLIPRQHDTYNKTCLQSCHNCNYLKIILLVIVHTLLNGYNFKPRYICILLWCHYIN